MKVQFDDGPAAVTLDEVDHPVKRGEAVQVSEALGKQLLEQGWRRSTPKRSTKKKTPKRSTKTEAAPPAANAPGLGPNKEDD